MEYSKDNTMTRKEYLKSKKKKNFFLSKLKYVLLLVIVVLLGIYVFKQLNVYNNVTKMANKVMEETKLAKTLTMYYVSEPYTKDGQTTLMLYTAYDESRKVIPGTDGLTNIQLTDTKLYGIKDSRLCAIDRVTYATEIITDQNVLDYVVTASQIYICQEDGVYKCDITTNILNKIIDKKANKILIDNNYLFIIANGKTSKSIIRYNLNGKSEKELSEKYIVSNMYIGENTIYFVNSKDSKLYSVSKSGGEVKKVLEDKVTPGNSIICYKDNIYYINSSDENMLYRYNIKNNQKEKIIKKNVSSIRIFSDVIYYSLANGIGIYKYDTQTGATEQVTSARTSEYICIK